MDLNRDELRRELRAVESQQRAALPQWRDALRRIFADRNGISTRTKAELLGVPAPGRRQFFRVGGATIIGAAILAACGEDNDDVAKTGTTTPAETGAAEPDLALLRTATSLELLAVDAYQAALDSGLITTDAISDTAALFQTQHQEHAEQLQGATEDSGGEPFTESNQFLRDNVLTPALPGLISEATVVDFAISLEDAAAQTYVFAAGALTTPESRQATMAIVGVETRHLAILRGLRSAPAVPVAFLPTTAAIPPESFVPAS
ncbi:hypothetical protein BH18ACT4_BH18ACT4_05340 [soil metagenome]